MRPPTRSHYEPPGPISEYPSEQGDETQSHPAPQVYVWHCDADGDYSGYGESDPAKSDDMTSLRGVQLSDACEQVHFTTVFPGWYAGRVTHIHVTIHLDAQNRSINTQLGFPTWVTAAVHDSPGYRGPNDSVQTLQDDPVVREGGPFQICAVRGSVAAGLEAAVDIEIDT